MPFTKTDFKPGDRVQDEHGRPGTFSHYDPDPRTACPDTHLSYPGMRIAYWTPDEFKHNPYCPWSIWENELSPHAQDKLR